LTSVRHQQHGALALAQGALAGLQFGAALVGLVQHLAAAGEKNKHELWPFYVTLR
jgi:hypothetical protein